MRSWLNSLAVVAIVMAGSVGCSGLPQEGAPFARYEAEPATAPPTGGNTLITALGRVPAPEKEYRIVNYQNFRKLRLELGDDSDAFYAVVLNGPANSVGNQVGLFMLSSETADTVGFDLSKADSLIDATTLPENGRSESVTYAFGNWDRDRINSAFGKTKWTKSVVKGGDLWSAGKQVQPDKRQGTGGLGGLTFDSVLVTPERLVTAESLPALQKSLSLSEQTFADSADYAAVAKCLGAEIENAVLVGMLGSNKVRLAGDGLRVIDKATVSSVQCLLLDSNVDPDQALMRLRRQLAEEKNPANGKRWSEFFPGATVELVGRTIRVRLTRKIARLEPAPTPFVLVDLVSGIQKARSR